METFEVGEPLSIQYLRFDPDAMSFHGLPEAVRHGASTIALVYEPKYVDALKTPMVLLKGRQLFHVYEEFAGIHYPGDRHPYPPHSDRSRKVPSTGYFGVHHLMATFPGALLELFGFTWQGWRWHDWDFEKREMLKYEQGGRLNIHTNE
ncbi:MAG: hypothetical protein M3Y27_16945 [Acidobacteriota bacterium]|nr:hypothetical protein [Acidobacteriota bacterium]